MKKKMKVILENENAETDQKIMIQKSPRLPGENLRPLLSSFPQSSISFFAFAVTNQNQKMNYPTPLAKKNEIRKRKKLYTSIVNRLILIPAAPIGESSSEPTGRERIPRPRSISKTTESINSIVNTKTTVEDLFP